MSKRLKGPAVKAQVTVCVVNTIVADAVETAEFPVHASILTHKRRCSFSRCEHFITYAALVQCPHVK